jgi:hypothetical protein
MADLPQRRDKTSLPRAGQKIDRHRSGNDEHIRMFVRRDCSHQRTRQEKRNESFKSIADHGFGCGFDGRINADAVCSS